MKDTPIRTAVSAPRNWYVLLMLGRPPFWSQKRILS
jgi:hypothetical protein